MIWELQHLIKYAIKGLVVVLNKLLCNYLMASKINFWIRSQNQPIRARLGVIPGYRWVCIGYMRDWNTCGQKWKQKSCDTL